MKPIPGTVQDGGAHFISTRWSVVLNSAAWETNPAEAERALAELCRLYWPPVYTFVRRRGHPPSDAQDLTQAFFVQMIEKRIYVRADPVKGRFRSFLLASLKHFLADARARTQAFKRGGTQNFLPLNEDLIEAESAAFIAQDASGTPPGAAGGEDRLFEERWAVALTGRALESLRGAYAAESREEWFDALRPFLGGGAAPVPDQADLAARLSVPLNTLRTHIHRLRERYRSILRAEVAQTVASELEVRAELRHLMRVLTDG